MSERPSDIDTQWGTLRRVTQDGEKVWKIRCPQCDHWGQIDDDQLHGRVSLDHTNCGASYAPSECACTWHETHDYASLPAVAFALRLETRLVEDKKILARLAAASPTPTGPEPAKCEHKRTEEHWGAEPSFFVGYCPGPATPTDPTEETP